MKTKRNPYSLARAALVATVALSSPSAFADGAITTYSDGDLFLGFRQTGVSNTLAVNIGSVTQFLPPSLGGIWDGTPFQVQFGVIPDGNPGAGNSVFSLAADLAEVFGLGWSENSIDGTSVRWAVIGFTHNALNNVPINGYNSRTAFVTKPRIDPDIQSTLLGSVSLNGFAGEFNSFATGIGGGSYINQESTDNSSVAYIGDGSQVNNWNSRIGSNGSFGLGANRSVEQLNSGLFQGPTDSVLDFYLAPSSGSTLATSRTYVGGSFTLNENGELFYGVIPEPGSASLVLAGAAILGLTRRRKSFTGNSSTSPH